MEQCKGSTGEHRSVLDIEGEKPKCTCVMEDLIHQMPSHGLEAKLVTCPLPLRGALGIDIGLRNVMALSLGL